MSTSSDELLARARTGDRAALEALIVAHQAQVYRFGLKMCRDPEDAKDVLQDTLIALARGVHDFRGASSLSTWLYTVARSFCIKKRRRSKFAPKHEHSLDDANDNVTRDLASAAHGPAEQFAANQVERALQTGLDALEPMYREVLVLRDAEGLTAPEVAEVLGISVGAVKSRLHRARFSMREVVAPLLDIPASEPSPDCPDVLRSYSQHLEQEISAELCAQMEQHLSGCAHCTATCDSLKRTLLLCRTSDAHVPVPAAVQRAVRAALESVLQSLA